MSTTVLQLPRRLFRKIAIEPTPEGWCVHVVGFDPRFYSNFNTQMFASRHEAQCAAEALGRRRGLPVITIETLAGCDGPPERAA